jgi:hypothetical protein
MTMPAPCVLLDQASGGVWRARRAVRAVLMAVASGKSSHEPGEDEMSYDIWLEVDAGGLSPCTVAKAGNMTSNVAPMWRKAMPDTDGLAGLHGKRGRECLAGLRAGLAHMEANPDEYERMNPANGWGTYKTAMQYVRHVITAAECAPNAFFHVSR